ncbi:MAG: hypothetical protein V3R98_07055 [Alphaproteobacteria bacterium]
MASRADRTTDGLARLDGRTCRSDRLEPGQIGMGVVGDGAARFAIV